MNALCGLLDLVLVIVIFATRRPPALSTPFGVNESRKQLNLQYFFKFIHGVACWAVNEVVKKVDTNAVAGTADC